MRAAEDAALNSYGWVDKEFGQRKNSDRKSHGDSGEERLACTEAGRKDAMMWFSSSLPRAISVRADLRPTPTKRNDIFLALFLLFSLFWASPLFAHDDRPRRSPKRRSGTETGSPGSTGRGISRRGGKNGSLKEYFGRRPVILSLVYYSCQDLCPLTLDGTGPKHAAAGFQYRRSI